jgi:hypothetical protein
MDKKRIDEAIARVSKDMEDLELTPNEAWWVAHCICEGTAAMLGKTDGELSEMVGGKE